MCSIQDDQSLSGREDRGRGNDPCTRCVPLSTEKLSPLSDTHSQTGGVCSLGDFILLHQNTKRRESGFFVCLLLVDKVRDTVG